MTYAERSGRPEWDGQQFALNDPRIPASIRVAPGRIASVGDMLWFCHTKDGGEWWLMDAFGDLIESFWLE